MAVGDFPKTALMWLDKQSGSSRDLKVVHADYVPHVDDGVVMVGLWLPPGGAGTKSGFAWTYGGKIQTMPTTVDNLTDGTAANMGTIPAWETLDTLRRPGGSPASLGIFGAGHNLGRLYVHAVPASLTTADKIARFSVYAAKFMKVYAKGFDGVWSDNVVFGQGQHSTPENANDWCRKGYRFSLDSPTGNPPIPKGIDMDGDGLQDDLDWAWEAYDSGLYRVMELIRGWLPGKYIGGNGINTRPGAYGGYVPEGDLKCANVTWFETINNKYAGDTDSFMADTGQWLSYPDPSGYPRIAGASQRIGSEDITNGQPANAPGVPKDAASQKAARWGMAASAIAGVAHHAVIAMVKGAAAAGADNRCDWWFDEYDAGGLSRGWLGQPIEAPVKLATNVWKRRFENGIVLCNGSNANYTFTGLGSVYRKFLGPLAPTINDGSAVSGSVTVAGGNGGQDNPGDGLFLIGASGPPPSNFAPFIDPAFPPTITATEFKVGVAMTGGKGMWRAQPAVADPAGYSYKYRRCDANGANCADIAGATAKDYAPVTADVGSTLRLRVTATNGVSPDGAADSIPTGVVQPAGLPGVPADGFAQLPPTPPGRVRYPAINDDTAAQAYLATFTDPPAATGAGAAGTGRKHGQEIPKGSDPELVERVFVYHPGNAATAGPETRANMALDGKNAAGTAPGPKLAQGAVRPSVSAPYGAHWAAYGGFGPGAIVTDPSVYAFLQTSAAVLLLAARSDLPAPGTFFRGDDSAVNLQSDPADAEGALTQLPRGVAMILECVPQSVAQPRPALQNVYVGSGGLSLVIVYDRNLDITSVPAVTDYQVISTIPVTLGAPSISGTTVTIPTSVIPGGVQLQLSYTPGVHPVRDVADALGFTSWVVRNSLPIVGGKGGGKVGGGKVGGGKIGGGKIEPVDPGNPPAG